jgi:hypothetical protein
MMSRKINLYYGSDKGYMNVKCEGILLDLKQEIRISCFDQGRDKAVCYR